MDTHPQRTRRDFVKAMSSALGGVSLLSPGTAKGQAIGSLPSGYKFYRVLTADQGSGGGIPTNIVNMNGSVMMASPASGSGPAYIYLHGQVAGGLPALFQIDIDYGSTPPRVTSAQSIATENSTINIDGIPLRIEHFGTGDSNSLGQYVTTLLPVGATPNTAPGVFLFTPGSNWSRLIRFADPAPDGSFYGADFGDIAIDDEENLLLVAATTQAPGLAESGFSGSQALITTGISGASQARVVFRTGDLLPVSSAAIRSVGLIDLSTTNAFAAQVAAKRLHNSARPGTALIVGNTQRGMAEHRVIAASPSVVPPNEAALLNIASGETFMGARVDPQQDVGFVTHLSSFERSIGSNDTQDLGYFARPRWRRLGRTRSLATRHQAVVSYNAPCLSDTGLLFETELLAEGSFRFSFFVGINNETLLQSGDRVQGINPTGELTITEIFFGQHSAQVDRAGRIAFTAEFQLSNAPSLVRTPSNYITALVVGIPQ